MSFSLSDRIIRLLCHVSDSSLSTLGLFRAGQLAVLPLHWWNCKKRRLQSLSVRQRVGFTAPVIYISLIFITSDYLLSFMDNFFIQYGWMPECLFYFFPISLCFLYILFIGVNVILLSFLLFYMYILYSNFSILQCHFYLFSYLFIVFIINFLKFLLMLNVCNSYFYLYYFIVLRTCF